MKKKILSFLLFAVLVPLQIANSQTADQATSQAASQSEGATPFYVWNDDIPRQAGQLLRHEPLPSELVLENAATGVRILYTSQGWDGRWIAVSGDVLIPRGAAPESGWPVMAWSHGTVGVADICAPSYNGRGARDIAYLNKWLAAGYAIVSTDYEGLGTPGGHTYLHCESEANGNIDAVRASQQLGQELSSSWMVMGQSQGGQGALCTGAYVANRAPEQNFLGTLATAPAVNWKERFNAGTADEPNPFIAMSLYLARGFEAFEPKFKSADTFTEAAMALLPHTDNNCVMDMVPLGMKANLTQGESLKVVPFGAAPGVSEGAAKMDVPTEGWSAPAYIAHGNADPLVRFEDAANYAAKLCANDVVVTLDIYEGAGHSGPVNQGFDNFSKWVAARFKGEPAQDNCTLIDEVTQ